MKRIGIAAATAVLVPVLLLGWTAWATEAEIYFAAGKNGEERVTKIHEGDEVWIVVYDPDEDIDCDVRDKVWTDIKVMDAKTGAHIVWRSYEDENGTGGFEQGEPGYVPHKGHWPGASAGWLGADYLEETSASTGLFVSKRPFMFGTRIEFSNDGREHAHIVGPYQGTKEPGANVVMQDFEWGGYLYADEDGDGFGDERVWVDRAGGFALALGAGLAPIGGVAYLPPGVPLALNPDYMVGRFENLDTIVAMYVDQNDPTDVALGLGKITDTEATMAWGREIYPDANEAALLTIEDPDENLSGSDAEMIPVFILVNPGSWNPTRVAGSGALSAVDFCSLKRYGGVIQDPAFPAGPPTPVVAESSIVWHNIYNNHDAWYDLAADGSDQPNALGTYYVEYPVEGDNNVTSFETATVSGVTRVMFYATETGPDTGIFQLRLNSILKDLGFTQLDERDVLVAYYVDPNDQDDFKLATAYIHEKSHSVIRFTDSSREDETVFWLGRDPVYVEVTDANANTEACCPEKVVVNVCDPHEVDDSEWLILDEMSSNSPVFFTHIGMKLISVWDAAGLGDPAAHGGYSLWLDNWSLEAFNEDSIYVRYNDVVYTEASLTGLGDRDLTTGFPPVIREVRDDNDVSFAVFEVGDTQVYDGETMNMRFLDRQGNPVEGYVNSDCVFIEVVDPDQDEDRLRRERIAAFWDGTGGAGQNTPFGPIDDPDNHADCGFEDDVVHPVNDLLGDTNVFSNGTLAKIYIHNPRNGRWAPVDLLETGVDTGTFVSVACVDLVNQHSCAPSLGVLPGDTIIAVYQDPSNHSDMAWISIKVGIGGGLPSGTGTTIRFADTAGDEVNAYLEGEPVVVKVYDASLEGAGTIPEAVTIAGTAYDLKPLDGVAAGTFVTDALDLGYAAGDTITATYEDPVDPNDTASATISVVAAELRVDRFYAGPSPFAHEVAFAYEGAGLADEISVAVYDLAGNLVWAYHDEKTLSILWDGFRSDGEGLANGAYIYVITAVGTEETFSGKGTVFIQR